MNRQTKFQCVWKQETDNDMDTYWETECGNTFYFADASTPLHNGFIYCPFCGKEIDEKIEEEIIGENEIESELNFNDE